jgi:hypothetical protein
LSVEASLVRFCLSSLLGRRKEGRKEEEGEGGKKEEGRWEEGRRRKTKEGEGGIRQVAKTSASLL